jgi:exodeoxyribonuclease V gamma subunit
MSYQGGKFKGKHLLALWIDHLAFCAAGLAGDGESSLLLSRDRNWRIPRLPADEARAQLEDYGALYREGMRRPLPIFPEISYLWAQQQDRDEARARAYKYWQNTFSRGGDRDNAYLQLVLRAGYRLPFEDDEFGRYARRLYTRLLELAEKP